jgi:hypothetical protein
MQPEERRIFHNLRAATRQAQPPLRDAMIRMARSLGAAKPGPDCLAEVDRELEHHFGMEAKIGTFTRRGMSRSEAMAKVRLMETPALDLPYHIKRKPMAEFTLTEATMSNLTASGIFFVEDFILKGSVGLVRAGLTSAALAETTERLLYHAIRTIDNPPERR